jgi:hypothetical protein
MRSAWFWLIVAAFVSTGWMARYTVEVGGSPPYAYLIDRWTGIVRVCDAFECRRVFPAPPNAG